MQNSAEQSNHSAESEASNDTVAASAAERAITDKQSSHETTDLNLDELATAVEQASLETSNAHSNTSTDNVVIESQPTEPSEPERELTKEEIIEEALNCPCIASMKEGPCGDPFLSAYRCFLESETEPKGMDCMEQFKDMQSCIADHPEEYNLDDDDENADPFAPKSSADTAEPSSEAPPAEPSSQSSASEPTLTPGQTAQTA